MSVSDRRSGMNGECEATEPIREAERRRQAALLSVDLDALDALFAENLLHIHSTGLVHGKAELREHIGRRRAFIAIERGPLDVRVEGNTAVMTGRQTSRMRSPGGDEVLMDGYVTQILRRSTDGWKFTNFQLTINRES